jgi:hypothetical protein
MLSKKDWLNPLYFSEAFLLRSTDAGLSVCYDSTPDQCMAVSTLTRSYGAAGLKVQSVRDLGLTVVPDSSHHAEIRGLVNKETDRDEAEYMASQLAKAATLVDQTRRPA